MLYLKTCKELLENNITFINFKIILYKIHTYICEAINNRFVGKRDPSFTCSNLTFNFDHNWCYFVLHRFTQINSLISYFNIYPETIF